MAKRSFGSLIAAVVGQLGFAAYRGYKEKRQVAEAEYRIAFRAAQQEKATEQAEYAAYVAKLPKLIGDGSFGLVADTATGDRFALESFTKYLDIMHEGEQVLTAILIAEHATTPALIAVELSQAHVGLVTPKDSEAILAAIAHTSGKVSCHAKLHRLTQRNSYQLLLDVKLPVELEGDTTEPD